MGNVLISFDIQRILREKGVTAPEDAALFHQMIFASEVWQAYDRGTVDKSAFIPLIHSLPPSLSALADDMIIRHIFAQDNMPPIPGMEELVKRAKEKGYGVYLLSNAGQDFYVYSQGIPALRHFDGLFVSSDYHLLKPEKEIYEAFFNRFSLLPEECLFVDDMPQNIEGAAACGMDGICFNAARQEISELYRRLEEKGVCLR